jgi:3-oxoacyl-[acyl-carrier protein] reductase
MLLQGKNAIVTGASRGIGRAIALELATQGANIACISRSLDSLQETLQAVTALGRKAQGYAVDVAHTESVDQTVEQISKDFGTLDILVNNAGLTRDTLMLRMSEQDWDLVLDTNLKGAFNWIKPVTRTMIRQRSGTVVNIASVIGLIGNAGQVNYSASKAGLIGLTKAVAREVASRGITVNVVCPGFIETDMTKELSEDLRKKVMEQIPLKRFGQPDDIAKMVGFLSGPHASFITGQTITVDGGMVMQ